MQTEPEVELVGEVHPSQNAHRTLVDASTQTDLDDHILYSHRSTHAPAPAPAPLPPPPPPPPPPPKTSLSRKFFRRADVPANTNAKASAPGNAKVSSEPTGGNYLSELKDRLARRNIRPNTLTVSPSQTRNSTRRSSSFSKFAAVKIRRHAHRNAENVKPEEEGELLRLFRQNKTNGGRRIALGALDPNTSSTSNNTTNATTTTRKLRRIVVPPVTEGALSSRNPQIQNELERLRAQAKVGGAGGGGSGSRRVTAAGDKEKQKNAITGLENPTGTK
ncbi:hypothetical protein R3P38DRAFT_105265 [Favolaschia claudopus]|uniref:Uncharacterized protein n=1 Tax=Favolaschia claudopus TaxID=2862362 RepID=A0AAV9ZY31_9AGAR